MPPPTGLGDSRRELAEQLVEEARATGVSLVGPAGYATSARLAQLGRRGRHVLVALFTEIRSRGVADVCIVVGDGLNGLPNAIAAT